MLCPPKTVTHPSTNRARRRVTLLIRQTMLNRCAMHHRPRPHCARRRPSPLLKKGAQLHQFSAYVCCGQMARWIKMPLGAKVGLGPGHVVLHGDPAPPKKGAQPPNFQQISMVAKWFVKLVCSFNFNYRYFIQGVQWYLTPVMSRVLSCWMTVAWCLVLSLLFMSCGLEAA